MLARASLSAFWGASACELFAQPGQLTTGITHEINVGNGVDDDCDREVDAVDGDVLAHAGRSRSPTPVWSRDPDLG